MQKPLPFADITPKARAARAGVQEVPDGDTNPAPYETESLVVLSLIESALG
jgi:hypothetical protein